LERKDRHPLRYDINLFTFLKVDFPTAKPLITKKRQVLPSTGQWGSIAKRKEFLLEFAQKVGFDPFVIDNWRNKKSQVIDYGVYSSTTQHSLSPPPHTAPHNTTLHHSVSQIKLIGRGSPEEV